MGADRAVIIETVAQQGLRTSRSLAFPISPLERVGLWLGRQLP